MKKLTLFVAVMFAFAGSDANAIERVARQFTTIDPSIALERDLRLLLEVQTERLSFQEGNLNKLVELELDQIEELIDEYTPQTICRCSYSACITPPEPPEGGDGGDGGGDGGAGGGGDGDGGCGDGAGGGDSGI